MKNENKLGKKIKSRSNYKNMKKKEKEVRNNHGKIINKG